MPLDAPAYRITTRILARSLGLTPEQLAASLRPVVAADLPKVLAFRRLHLGARVRWADERYLPWRYDLGESGRGFGELWALWRGDEPLGIVGNERMTLRRGELLTPAQRLQDLLVKPEMGDSGLAVWLNQALFQRAPLTLAVGANEMSAGVVRRLFKPLPPMQQALHPIRWKEFAARSQRVPGWMRPVALLAGAGHGALRQAQRAMSGSGLRAEPLLRFADDAEPMASPATRRDTVIALRSGTYMNRRALQSTRVHMGGVQLPCGPGLTAYIVWRREQVVQGQYDLRVVDWGVPSGAEPGVWSALWDAAVQEAQREGCTAVRVSAQNAAALPRLRRHGFIARDPAEGKIVGIHLGDGVDAAPWLHDDWCLTEISDDCDEA